jgi:hypothetical protein
MSSRLPSVIADWASVCTIADSLILAVRVGGVEIDDVVLSVPSGPLGIP